MKIFNINLKKDILSTFNDAVIDNFGGFSSVLDINKLEYNDPLLLSATDGVGTKLKLAIEAQNFDAESINQGYHKPNAKKEVKLVKADEIDQLMISD